MINGRRTSLVVEGKRVGDRFPVCAIRLGMQHRHTRRKIAHGAFCRGQRDAGREAGEQPRAIRVSTLAPNLRRHLEWHEQVGRLAADAWEREPEFRSRHADDGRRFAIDADRSANDTGIGIESPSP
jgi:hypothetical protein